MGQDDGVNQPGSPSGKSDNPSGQGNGSSKTDEKLAELTEALKKKDKAIEDLHGRVQELMEDKEERIQELENKKRLNSNEEDELATLQDQVTALKRDKRAKPWLKVQEDISDTVATKRIDALDLSYAEDYVRELAEIEGKSEEDMNREIVKYMRKADPEASMKLLPRAKAAYKLLKRTRDLEKKEAELLERERKFAEVGGTKQAKVPTKEEVLDWKGSSNPEKSLEGLLAGIQEAQSK